MVKVYLTSFHQKFSPARFDHYLTVLPDRMKQHVLQYQRWEDRHASLFGKLLLRQALHDQRGGLELESILYSEYGKPFVDGNVSFSISHSGSYVMCAISNSCRVGLDIEQIRNEINIDDFKSQFSPEEWNGVVTAADSLRAFYALWTSKEAVIKADGRGISVIDQTTLSAGVGHTPESRWIITEIPLNKNYIARLATSEPLTAKIILEALSFP